MELHIRDVSKTYRNGTQAQLIVVDEPTAGLDPLAINALLSMPCYWTPEGDGAGVPLALGRHRIRSGKQTSRIATPREPARAGVDPFRKLIEREREDNVIEVKCCGTTEP